MEKVKLLTFSVIALLLLNLGTLGFLIFSARGDRPGRRPEPKEIIIEKLHFDSKQQTEYESLIHDHRNAIDKLDNDIVMSRAALYLQLASPQPDANAMDSLTNVIAAYQKQVEVVHFLHFANIKSICRKDQQKAFDAMTLELASIFSHPRPRP
ncbi:hypothetical protein [Flavobacterium sp. 3HN19-14]|uniref:hypothetical protein n=1 Tax=Flavobacterium sp. 3HN19-14 TaxID=3448133 RepID=UPI003EE02BEF